MLIGVSVWIASCGTETVEGPVFETGTVTDIDGITYQTVKIGGQWWMTENLRTTTFRSGTKILNITDGATWANATTPAYALYNNASGQGLLYNYHVVTSDEGIAPEGWRVPTDDDWKILEEYLGMRVEELDRINWRGSNEGDKLKARTTRDEEPWFTYQDGSAVWGTDEVGFSARGGSCRLYDGRWGNPGLREAGYWWTSSEQNGYGWYRYLDHKRSGIFRYTGHPNYGFSIRCVKN